VKYFQIHIFDSSPERLTGKLSKILSFPQTSHKLVIKGNKPLWSNSNISHLLNF